MKTGFSRLALRTSAGFALLALLASLSLVPGCSSLLAEGRPAQLALDPADPETGQVGELDFAGGLVLAPAVEGFGGLSGLAVSEDSSRLWAVSDKGDVVTGDIVLDDAGRLADVRNIRIRPLIEDDGDAVSGKRSDAEDLARLPDGRWAVSFERWHRIELYPDDPEGPVGRPQRLKRPPGAEEAPGNGGIEALAALPDGRLLAIEEGGESGAGRHRAWIGGEKGWERLTYLGEAPYRPTAATALPGGDLLVLERRASLLGGFGARIVRVPGDRIAAGVAIEGREIARLEPPLAVDNFEGMAAVPEADGGIRIFLVSDDNFWALQRTLLMSFHLPFHPG